MFGLIPWANYLWQLNKLQRSRSRMLKGYEKERLSVPKGPDHRSKIESIDGSREHEDEMALDEIALLKTQYLMSEADRHFVTLPPFDDGDMWRRSHQLGEAYLTRKGMAQVYTDIVARKKAAREAWVTPSIGLIGALIGLVAAFKK